MMGHQGGVQDKLFYSFNLDDHVPQSHLLRGIDRVFDLRDLRHHRWFCRLGLEDEVPDHSTFSKNRHGPFRDSDALRHVFGWPLQAALPSMPTQPTT
jgi:transposase